MEILAPDNVRTEFSTIAINTGANVDEEANKDIAYEDNIYEHAQDSRSVNVVERIKEGVPYQKIEDDVVSAQQVANKLTDMDTKITDIDTRVTALETDSTPE